MRVLARSTRTPRSHLGATPQAPATALADRTHAITVSTVDPTTGIERLSAGELSVTIDTVAPAQPTFSGSAPASPAHTTTPTVKGSTEAGATVNLYSDVLCTAPAAASTVGIAALAYGVLPLRRVLPPEERAPTILLLLHRISPIAYAAVIVLTLAGLYNVVNHLGPPSLWRSSWDWSACWSA